MTGHACLKNEFTKDKKYHNLMSWLIFCLQDSDEEEHFVDLHNPESDTENVDNDDNEDGGGEQARDKQEKSTSKPGWFHRANMNRKCNIL